jgi:hypothetical protein
LDLSGVPQWSVATVSGGDFRIYDETGQVNRLYIKTDTGNVGIGTINPGFKLDVSGQIRSLVSGDVRNLVLDQSAPNTKRSQIAFAQRGVEQFLIGVDATVNNSRNFFIVDRTAGNRLLITATGNIGIGTTSPGEKLTVAGVIHSTTGGFRFPDGTIQTTAATGGAAGWALTGNPISAGQFLGTTNNEALDIRVNNARALRLEPHAISPNLIGGSKENVVTSGVVGATIGGGGSGAGGNQVTDDYGMVGGGTLNKAGDSTGTTSDSSFATVGGGVGNTASSGRATVSGGNSNTASGGAATVGGGQSNTASGNHATVGGGEQNTASGNRATVGGGWTNEASGGAATVSGGEGNTASGGAATVGGGEGNTASGNRATVGGGWTNEASGNAATVSGGQSNTASRDFATVGGGIGNWADGSHATVGGGGGNIAAGDYSFVVGRRAKNTNDAHDGVFLFADSTNADFSSSAANEFAVRASGGYRLYSNSGLTAGVTMAAGASAWSAVSDRALKENFRILDRREVLHRLSLIPITEWNYKAQDTSIRHIGPMAQDFYAAFGLGESDRHISTIDADGIALLSIQALYELSLEKEKKIEQLTKEIERLRTADAKKSQEITELKARLEALEKIVQELMKK